MHLLSYITKHFFVFLFLSPFPLEEGDVWLWEIFHVELPPEAQYLSVDFIPT